MLILVHVKDFLMHCVFLMEVGSIVYGCCHVLGVVKLIGVYLTLGTWQYKLNQLVCCDLRMLQSFGWFLQTKTLGSVSHKKNPVSSSQTLPAVNISHFKTNMLIPMYLCYL